MGGGGGDVVFNETATTEIYTLSLHDALPISEFEIVERNQLEELCLASPAIAGNKLLIRTASALYCITDGAKRPADDKPKK